MKNRRCVICRNAQTWIYIRTLRAFINSPSVVCSARDDVDFLDRSLTHIARPKLARSHFVKGPTKRVSHTDGVNLVGTVDADEWIIGRNRISRRRVLCEIRRYAKKLTKQVVDVLSTVSRIIGRPAIAHADIQVVDTVVVAELDHSTIVVVERLQNN